MYSLFRLALLFALLLDSAAAANAIMDQAICGSPQYTLSPDAGYMFNTVCTCCALHVLECKCAMHDAYVPARMLNHDIASSDTPIDDSYHTMAHLAPVLDFVGDAQCQPLMSQNIQCINTDETKVQATTVLEHVKDTYTPGDRTNIPRRPGSDKAPQKRQAPRRGGFPCGASDCKKTFNRFCDVNRHQKIHMAHSERPHKCKSCPETFLYPKDLERHEQKHIHEPSAKKHFRCLQPGCGNLFSRRDNLLRHRRNQHSMLAAASI